MERTIIGLRLPRLVTGTLVRGREVERVAVHDEVPVSVAVLDSDRTRPAWRSAGGAREVYMAADGIPYAPLDHDRLGEADRPERLWPGLAERIASEAGIGARMTHFTQQRLADWSVEIAGASRRRGLCAAEDARFRDVVDDGRARQADLARRIGASLALVPWVGGGYLYHRTSLPRVRVSCHDGSVSVHDVQPRLPLGAPEGEPLGFEDFRIDRRDDAEAFAEACRRELGLEDSGTASGRLEVLDPGALAACYARPGEEADLAALAVADGALRALRPVAGDLPDALVLRYLDLRGAVARGDAAGARAWLDLGPAEGPDGARGALADLAASRDPDLAERASGAAAALAPALLRRRAVDLPRLFLEDGDGDALGLLAPG